MAPNNINGTPTRSPNQGQISLECHPTAQNLVPERNSLGARLQAQYPSSDLELLLAYPRTFDIVLHIVEISGMEEGIFGRMVLMWKMD